MLKNLYFRRFSPIKWYNLSAQEKLEAYMLYLENKHLYSKEEQEVIEMTFND